MMPTAPAGRPAPGTRGEHAGWAGRCYATAALAFGCPMDRPLLGSKNRR